MPGAERHRHDAGHAHADHRADDAEGAAGDLVVGAQLEAAAGVVGAMQYWRAPLLGGGGAGGAGRPPQFAREIFVSCAAQRWEQDNSADHAGRWEVAAAAAVQDRCLPDAETCCRRAATRRARRRPPRGALPESDQVASDGAEAGWRRRLCRRRFTHWRAASAAAACVRGEAAGARAARRRGAAAATDPDAVAAASSAPPLCAGWGAAVAALARWAAVAAVAAARECTADDVRRCGTAEAARVAARRAADWRRRTAMAAHAAILRYRLRAAVGALRARALRVRASPTHCRAGQGAHHRSLRCCRVACAGRTHGRHRRLAGGARARVPPRFRRARRPVGASQLDDAGA